MDWVDFKRNAIRYRSVYSDLYLHTSSLLRDCVKSYAHYRMLNQRGVKEERVILQYGITLWYLAELQNLTTGYATLPVEYDWQSHSWEMTKDAIQIVASYQDGKSSKTALMNDTAQWCRDWYAYFVTPRHFKESMIEFVKWQNERENNTIISK